MLVGCQGRLNIVLENLTGHDFNVISDGMMYSVVDGAEVRFPAPADHKIIIKTENESYTFHVPFNRRPHVLNGYIDTHLVTRMQANTLREIAILPMISNTNGIPILLVGQSATLQP